MTLEELEVSWNSVEIPSSPNSISGTRASGMSPNQPVYLAIDDRHRRHLLIQVPDDTPDIRTKGTRGLEVRTEKFSVGSNPEALYVDLICVDHVQNPTFCAVTQDILRTLGTSIESPRDSVISALARWRAFWSVQTEGMSHEGALGLFGELWFMRRWLAPVSLQVVERWQVTESARHDFQWPAASVEVKTAAARSEQEPIHPISNLEQLADPEQGELYLFSLHVTDDALAVNTVHSLVEGLVDELQNDVSTLTNLNEKLVLRGYNPADRQAPARTLRILAERLYRVEDGFPRLTRASFEPNGIPAGIANIKYDLDLATCSQWLIAKTPSDKGAAFLRTDP